MPAGPEKCGEAEQLYRAGRLAEAEALCREVLAEAPRHPPALHLLGVLATRGGRPEIAAELIGQAIDLDGAVFSYRFDLGVALLALKRAGEAEAAFREALRLAPSEAKAHGNLGVALHRQGRIEEALAEYTAARDLAPDDPDFAFNAGNAFCARGQREEALAAYDAAHALRADYPRLQARRGAVLSELGRIGEAEEALEEACRADPEDPVSAYCLARMLHELGRYGEAIAAYRNALRLKPRLVEAQTNLAVCHLARDENEEAAAAALAALRLDPDCAEGHANLGAALHGLGRFEEAIAACRSALRLRPEMEVARANLAAALLEIGAFEESLACCDEALRGGSALAEIHSNRGAALTQLGRFEEAIEACRAALRLRPGYPEAHSNFGNALRCAGRIDEAEAAYRAALALKADYPGTHTNLGMLLLSRGRFEEGWREYEWRWRMRQTLSTYRETMETRWHGEAGDGRTLLLHAEQGFGDTLQFCRYAKPAAARGWRVVLMVQPPLARLLRSLGDEVEVVATRREPLPFDLQCPLLSLPMVLGTTPATIPGEGAYLHADPAAVASWRARLDGLGRPGLRVGIAWAGNPRASSPGAAAVDRRRSIDPALLAPLFAVAGVHFISLQKDGPAAPEEAPLTDVMAEMDDFADTAALVAGLDLVISVDTAIVHLAGALGRPVWMLDRFDHCWRWMDEQRDSPWYPGLRIFRQPGLGQWREAVADIAAALARKVSKQGSTSFS